jgi:hypothetical protein
VTAHLSPAFSEWEYKRPGFQLHRAIQTIALLSFSYHAFLGT